VFNAKTAKEAKSAKGDARGDGRGEGLLKTRRGTKKGERTGGNFLAKVFVNGISVASVQGVLTYGCFFC
jgi:hypothetical protein